ncbi:hypothetical protein MML48_4g00001117 [Holotrichia oblita]|uniref:Uncharacterized protein n=1 Tax=Holotrichia oblita TaxID=644536 RepID=A0ACB9T762_HOLOL|nr:hypothetical protein MML48_4g00001117 [Holotrichia oblita]
MEKHELFDKPRHIFNMEETGLQLNNRPSHVISAKGSKAVSTVTSTEKGETLTVIACCIAEGGFMPPTTIMKGKYKKAEFQDGMPPGAILFISQKSAYINSELFMNWLKEYFLPRKPDRKVLLVLGGHSTHCNSVEMLEFADSHDIILVTMPSHTSHYLQPLDRAVFKSLKSHFYESCQIWLKRNPGRRITRLQFSELLSEAWGKSATPQNAISAFRATGIYPLNPSAIPDCAFCLAQDQVLSNANKIQQKSPSKLCSALDLPGTSHDLPSMFSHPPFESDTTIEKKETPSKILQDISIVPLKTPARKRAKQVATLLRSPEHILNRKVKEHEKMQKEKRKRKAEGQKLLRITEKEKKKNKKNMRKIKQDFESWSASESKFIPSCDSDLDVSDDLDSANNYRGWGENYYLTKKAEDWIRCVLCSHWLHENCTEFTDTCNECGKCQNMESCKWKGKGIGKGKTKKAN